MRHLAEGAGDEADFGDLATDVEVDEFHAVAQTHRFEAVESFEEFGTVEPELRSIAAGRFPFACGAGSELDADAQIGAHAHLFGRAGNDVQFGELLDDEKDAFAHLLRQEGEFDEVLVLMAVADDERFGVHVGGQDRVEFGLRAAFETEVVLLAVGDDFLHHRAHLIDLDGIDDEVLALVFVFLLGTLKAGRGFLNAVVEDVGEAQQDRRSDIALCQLAHHFVEIYLGVVLAWTDVGVSFFVDAEIVDAPTFDVVKLLGVFNSPFSHCAGMVGMKGGWIRDGVG